jgi:hypothetical protein
MGRSPGERAFPNAHHDQISLALFRQLQDAGRGEINPGYKFWPKPLLCIRRY